LGIERSRVTEVYAAGPTGSRVGSGYVVNDGLVLTARHVVNPSSSVEVRPLGQTEWMKAAVTWSDEAAEVALLRVESGGAGGDAGTPLRWGMIAGHHPVAVTAVGFPWAQVRPDATRDTEQLFGHVAPLTGLKADRYSVSVTTSAPDRAGGGSGWAGMSGAALFAGPHLVGVVVVDPARFGPDRVVAIPAAVLAPDEEFGRLVGVQRDLTTVGSRFRLEVAAGLSVAVVSPYRPLPPSFDPLAVPVVLLDPHHGIVPFSGRESQLAELARWCEAEVALGVRVLTGPVGSGKTRLAAEACVDAIARGWVAGFADAHVPGGETALKLEDPTLLVVEEADTKVDLVASLISQLLYTPRPARVVLVARGLGLWYDQLAQEVPYLEGLPGVAQPLSLDRALLDEEQRQPHFAAAAAAFAPHLGAAVPAESPWRLADAAFATPLLVHMSALVAATGSAGERRLGEGRDARSEVLDGLIQGERQRWRRIAAVAGLADLEPQVADRAVAVATLTGARNETEALALLEVVFELADPERRAKVARWLHELYPGDAWANPLQPDLLAARHLGLTLPAAPDLVTQLYDRAPDRRAALVASLLRASTEELALEPVLHSFVEGRLESLVQGAIVDASLAPVIARVSQLTPVPALAAAVVGKLPDRSTSLAALTAVLQEQTTSHYRALAEANPDAFMPDLASSLNNLSIRLAQLGRHQDALQPIEEAVGHYRALAEANPDAFMPDLASSLTTLSNRLVELGRRQDALGPIEEAVGIRRMLAEANADAFMPDLARSLNNLSNCLVELGRRQDALQAIEEAVGHYRALAEANPDAFMPDLASSLTTLSNCLSELGRRQDALQPIEDAVGHYRALAEANPDAFMPNLAASLNNLLICLGELGRREDALGPIEEAVGIRRMLAEANADAFMPDLARSLNNLSICLAQLGRREGALGPIEEAVGHYRALAEASPEAFLPELASSLNTLSICLAQLGRREDALGPIEEAVGHYRALAEANPEAFLPDLAASLNTLSNRLVELGRHPDALQPFEEAVGHYRALAEANPDAFLPDLAASLNNLSICLGGLGRERDAHAAAQEAALLSESDTKPR
jgi:tetratricopeptide (TPR) repeat protein